MKLRLNPANVKTWFTHERSETEILVEAMQGGALITFFDGNNANATLLISTRDELTLLKNALANLKDKHDKDLRGFADENVVLSIDYDNYGDPFEECIRFSFCIANSDTPWADEVSASLNYSDVDLFINAITNVAAFVNLYHE